MNMYRLTHKEISIETEK